jgi:hypothetical protein
MRAVASVEAAINTRKRTEMEINHTRFVIATSLAWAYHFSVARSVAEAVFDPIGYSLRSKRAHDANSPSSAFASCRSSVWNPSVNQP